jgi:glycosyltransferase involved in cell wall biosynthesis
MKNGRPFSIVCLSSQDWHVDLPTNRQQIMRAAARRGHHVLFVETGSFLGIHLWRLLRSPGRSLARRLFGREPVAPGIDVVKAVNVLPWGHRFGLASSVNMRLTRARLRNELGKLPRPVVYWIYDPCALGAIEPGAFAVYDCVDDYAEQAGGDAARRALVGAADAKAAELARVVFATTDPLYAKHRERNAETHLVPNVGDFDHFSAAAEPGAAAPEVDSLRRPVLGFAGNLVTVKVDFDLLEEVARSHAEWTILLVGPVRADAGPAVERLGRLPNVRLTGPKPYGELPGYVASFDVALIPYLENAYTRSCFPLKLYEYLAAGKPVVVSGLPHLAGREPDVVVVRGAEELAAAVATALDANTSEDRERRRALAAGNTWETRTDTLLGLVHERLGA